MRTFVESSTSFASSAFVFALTSAFSCTFASPTFAQQGARITEVFGVSPRQTTVRPFQKQFTRPQRSWTSFGGALDARGFSTTVLGRFGVSQIPLRGTLLAGNVNVTVVPVCGPSPHMNTLACHNLATGEALEEFPIPGSVSTQPLFFDGSWFFGTTKGFFIRTDGTSLRSTPLLGGENTGLWGAGARRMMRGLRPRTALDGPETPSDATSVFRNGPHSGWRWYATSSFEYVGTPLVFGSQVFVLTANQYLLSLDVQTGKTVWSVRLAPESSLRVSASPLSATAKEILVGTDDGQLMGLNPKDGAVLWRYVIPARGDERFKAITAAPLVTGRSVVFSNVESLTTRLSLDGRTVEWSYPMGTVAQVRSDDASLYVAGTDGSVAALDARTGVLRWKVVVSADTPLASLQLLRKKEMLLVANKKGALFALDLRSGRQLAQTFPVGEPVGEFISGYAESDACLTYSNEGLRCYLVEGVASGLASSTSGIRAGVAGVDSATGALP